MSVFNRMVNGSRGCMDLLACVYELNALESQAYFALVENPGSRMEELADVLDRDRSTVHRAVQKLLHLQLAERETVPMKGGGYYHRYNATSPEQVRHLIESRLDDFQQAVRSALDSFEDEVEDHVNGSAPEARTP